MVPNRDVISARVEDYPAELQPFADQLEGRSMLVKRAKMIEIECVARGYHSGSGWKDIRQPRRSSAAFPFRKACSECSKLPEPIFTPAPEGR